MKSSLIALVALTLTLSSVADPAMADRRARSEAAAPDRAIKPGSWEFAAQLQAAAAAQPTPPDQPAGGQPPPGAGGLAATYRMCVDANRAVPAKLGPNCSIGQVVRNGGQITWAMTCTNQDGAVQSDGAAQYRGDSMAATLVNHVPAPDGKVTDITQRITGRYAGPCSQAGEAEGSSTATSDAIEPPTARSAPPQPAVAENAARAAPYRQGYSRYAAHHRRYARYNAGGYGPPNVLALPFMALRSVFGR